MEYIYAALLLHKLKKEISEENVRKIVKATGIDPDEIKVKALVSALREVNIDEALKAAVSAPAVAQPAPTPSAAAEAAKEKPAEEKKEEKKEEEALAGLSSLFG